MSTYTVPKPCHQSWSGFIKTTGGGFCPTCSKEVIDFTLMAEAEIADHIKNNPKTCGRFKREQLRPSFSRTYPFIQPSLTLLRIGLIGLLLTGVSGSILAQSVPQQLSSTPVAANAVIRGKVTSDDGASLPGVNIYVKNSDIGTVSDADGFYEFKQNLKVGDRLIFSYIGFISQEHEVTSEHAELNVQMVYDSLIILGEVVSDEPFSVKQTKGLKKLFVRRKNGI